MLWLLSAKNGRPLWKQAAAWLVAAAAKFALLYLLVAKVVCGVLAPGLLSAGIMKQPMLKALPVTFSWPQLFTALIGGGIALLIVGCILCASRKKYAHEK